MWRLGVVSFLNARPLIEGLGDNPAVRCTFAVPAALPDLLDRSAVDAALIPIVDLLRRPGHYRVVSDACIACDGETMTVRVFSHTPPHRVRTLWVDPDSHTSVALARVLWRELFDCDLELRPLDTSHDQLADRDAVLLIGDKVVDPRRAGFGYEVDLGGAWRQHTGLPFVFAVWACHNQQTPLSGDDTTAPCATNAASTPLPRESDLATLLSTARDRGVANAATIANEEGPAHGWSVPLANRYLTRCLTYRLDHRTVEGANLFATQCAAAGLVPSGAEVLWPANLKRRQPEVAS